MANERRNKPTRSRRTKKVETRKVAPQKPKVDTDSGSKESTVIMEGLKKVGSPRQKGTELKIKGISLGLKFALVISIVAALLCTFASLIVYNKTEKALIAEIDRKGAATVKSIGSLAKAYYHEYLQADKEEKKEGLKTEEINTIRQKKRRIVAKYKNSLSTLVVFHTKKDGKETRFSEEILNVSILSERIPGVQSGKVKYKTIALEDDNTFFEDRLDDETIKTDIKILNGDLLVDKNTYKVKVFQVALYPNNNLDAFVCISQKDIERTTDTAFSTTIMTTVIAVGIGLFISILLAQLVTKPIRKLIRDVEIVSKGDLNHNTTATSKDEVGILAHTFNIMTKNLKIAHQSELERQARQYEMQIATDIQSHLLPSQIPQIQGYDIAAYYHPSKEVGGDYYDFIQIDPDHIGFIVADVSGKSIPGSMVMTMARSLIRMQAFHTHSPAQMFNEVNEVLEKDIRKGMFVTAMYAVLRISTGEVILSSAGHNPGVAWRAATGKNDLINPKGMALGLTKKKLFSKTVRDEKFLLASGDALVLYTDGVPEAMDPANEEYSEERFYQLVTRHAGKTSSHLVNTIVQSMEDWRKDCEQSDDITIVSIKKK